MSSPNVAHRNGIKGIENQVKKLLSGLILLFFFHIAACKTSNETCFHLSTVDCLLPCLHETHLPEVN